MKYTREEFIRKLEELELVLKMARDARSQLYYDFVHSEPYKKADRRIAECEEDVKRFKLEHYSDFGVYTNGERQLSGRIDGSIMRREATLVLIRNIFKQKSGIF